MTQDISDKRALITGAASGIGLATAERFARAGARVALKYLEHGARGPAEVTRLRAAGLHVIDAPGEVSVPDDAKRMVVNANHRLDGLDYLVNNAGTAGPASTAPIRASDLGAAVIERIGDDG